MLVTGERVGDNASSIGFSVFKPGQRDRQRLARDRGGRLRRQRLRAARHRRRRGPLRGRGRASHPARDLARGGQRLGRRRGDGVRLPPPRLSADRAAQSTRDGPSADGSGRRAVAWACRILADEGYQDLTLGHVSARDAQRPERMWIKRRGVTLAEVTPADVIEFDLGADLRDASDEMHLEAVLHTEVYRRRDDVGAIVHGHPPYATAFGATDADLLHLTHDAVMFDRRGRRLRRQRRSDHRARAGLRGRRGARRALGGAAAKPRRAGRPARPGVDGAGGGDPRAGADAAVDRRDAGRPAADRADAGRRPQPPQVHTTASSTSTGRPGFATCAGAASTTGWSGCRERGRGSRSTATPRELVVPAQELLLDMLRERLGLTGAKRSCDVQVCGTCTVLVDGAAGELVHLPRLRRGRARGADDRGLRRAARSSPSSSAPSTERAALQCGFCTPGFVLTLKALRDAGELATART